LTAAAHRRRIPLRAASAPPEPGSNRRRRPDTPSFVAMSSLRRVAAVAAAVAACALAGCDTGDGRALRAPAPGATAPALATSTTPATAVTLAPPPPPVGSGDVGTVELTSTAFLANTAIPARHSCEGEGTSPPLSWTAVPAGTVELAITVIDPDAPGTPFVHWVVAGIDPVVTGFGEAGLPETAVEVQRWAGPCPPPGETHDYVFTLYLLTSPSGIEAGSTLDGALAALEATPGPTATLVGTFGRPA
jgi:Raf kinase inhibitor-like YbhB/YbcL family protein